MKRHDCTVFAFAFAFALVGCSGGGDHAPAGSHETAPAATAQPAPAQETAPASSASAHVESKSGSSLTGHATFTERDGMVTLELTVQGAPPGELAVHLHEVPDCSAADGSSAGPHWNPGGVEHGHWGVAPFHMGDVGNLQVGPDGTGTLTLTTDLWSIRSGDPARDVIGRSVVVHEKADDFKTQPTGAAGGRIGCGVIE
jgi:Cu-Zn family superoxide dismutase